MNIYISPSERALEFYTSHSFAYEGDSGLDLFFVEDVVIPAKKTVLVDLEVAVELRAISNKIKFGTSILFSNKSMLLFPRSSIYKTPLRMSNSVGLIDSKYRGNLKVPLDNISNEDYTIKRGEKLVQIVAPNLEDFIITVSQKLSNTDRGSNGFGSSGK